MPLRPPPYTWVLRSFDAVSAAARAICEELDPGFVADLVAKANGDPAVATRALLETDPSKRARLVEAAVRDA
jgi:hypothetical protein